MKKLLTLLTIAVIGLSTFGLSYELDPSIRQFRVENAVSWLYTNGYTIFSNTKDYQPNNYMRRDEAAKFFVKVAEGLGKTEYVKTASECSFSDLNDGHADLKDVMVKSCRLGIFQGHEGKFMPTWALTNSQAIVVMMRIISWDESEAGTNHWADNYYNKANDILREEPDFYNRESLATRGNVAVGVYTIRNQVLWEMWEYSNDLWYTIQYPIRWDIQQSDNRIQNYNSYNEDYYSLKDSDYYMEFFSSDKDQYNASCTSEFSQSNWLISTSTNNGIKVYRWNMDAVWDAWGTLQWLCFIIWNKVININVTVSSNSLINVDTIFNSLKIL